MSYNTTQSELESLFSGAGQVVEVFLPSDRTTGRPRGFAFIQFAQDAGATQAIEQFDGHQLNGRNLSVKMAEERQHNPSSPSREWSSSGPRTPEGSRPKSSMKGSKPKGSRRNTRSALRDRKRGF